MTKFKIKKILNSGVISNEERPAIYRKKCGSKRKHLMGQIKGIIDKAN